MIGDLFGMAFEKVLQKAFDASPNSGDTLTELSGQSAAIHLNDFNATIYLNFDISGCSINIDDQDADVTLSGSLKDFIHHWRAEDPNPMRSGLRIEGDHHTAQVISKFFKSLDIDWEDELAKLVGDTLSYRVTHLFSQAKTQLGEHRQNLADTVKEGLQEELRILPTQAEAEYFAAEIEDLDLRLARLEARFRHIGQQLSSKASE